MNRFEVFKSLKRSEGGKMLLFVMDGLGGLEQKPNGETELESAQKPNLNELASEGICGLHNPCSAGITPGSGPAHLGLFGYDPFEYNIGRGVLEALGIDFELKAGDLAIRVNFCTVDKNGIITDRRAGRIATEVNAKLCEKLRKIKLPGVEIFVEPVKEHRAAIVFRGKGLHGGLADSDPQQVGHAPLTIVPTNDNNKLAAKLCNDFVAQAKEILKNEHPANMVLLRGIDRFEHLPIFEDIFGVKAAAIATYPMYRGLARLVGMTVIKTGETPDSEIDTLEQNFANHDFFYVHIKKTDSTGEDGNFDGKIKAIEMADKLIERVRKIGFDVIAVTGDHSTPAVLKGHSWHPVPVVLWSKVCRADDVKTFGERACVHGGLGIFPAVDLIPLMLANADRLAKYGA